MLPGDIEITQTHGIVYVYLEYCSLVLSKQIMIETNRCALVEMSISSLKSTVVIRVVDVDAGLAIRAIKSVSQHFPWGCNENENEEEQPETMHR